MRAVRSASRLILLGAAALALGASAAQAQEACRADAVPCCDWPAPDRAARSVPPSFGTQVWPSSLVQNPASVEKLVALKPRHLRFSLGPNWRLRPALQARMSDAELDAAVAAGFASVTNAERHAAIMREVAARTGARSMLIVWEPPPLPGEPDFTVPKAPVWRVLKPEHIRLAARFHVALLRAVAAAGVAVTDVELANEPDGSWNMKIAPADYLALLRAVREEAARRHVTLPRIFGPGASRVVETHPYFRDATVGAGILDAVDVVSLHGWDDAVGRDRAAELETLLARFAALGRKPEIAFTEFGVGRPELADTSERMNARNRGEGNIALSPAYGGYSLRDLMRLYSGKVGIVIQWEFQDQAWGRGSLGLLDVHGREKPVYHALRRLAERLDAERPDAIEASPDGRLAILRKSGRDSLIVANPAREPLDIVLRGRRPGDAPAVAACGAAGGAGVRVPAESVTVIPLVGR